MSEKQQSVREIGSKINFKVIVLIIVLAIAYHAYISLMEQDDEILEFADIAYGIGASACGIFSIIISRRYKGSAIFSKTYLALGIGFLCLAIGDIIFNYYEIVLHEYPYPSIADVFFLAFPPLVTYHLVLNIRYFMKDLDITTVVGQVSFPVSIVFVYAFLSFDEMAGFDLEFFISFFYVLSSSVILSLSMLGLSIFRKSVLGIAWLLLAMGIFANMIADNWYYYTELLDVFDSTHPVNTIWILGFMMIFYALYKHKQII